eukprot:3334669-Pyramimonas_sp.AAC.1
MDEAGADSVPHDADECLESGSVAGVVGAPDADPPPVDDRAGHAEPVAIGEGLLPDNPALAEEIIDAGEDMDLDIRPPEAAEHPEGDGRTGDAGAVDVDVARADARADRELGRAAAPAHDDAGAELALEPGDIDIGMIVTGFMRIPGDCGAEHPDDT